jgi:hypothetical protein
LWLFVSFPTVGAVGYPVNRPDGTSNPLNIAPQLILI